MKWLLIIFFVAAGNNGVSVTSVEMLNKDACENAARQLTGRMELGEKTMNGPHEQAIKAVCIINGPAR